MNARLRLHYGMPPSFILAKDSKRGKILRGGLGILGVGQMWQDVTERDLSSTEYRLAPEMEEEGGTGRLEGTPAEDSRASSNFSPRER